MIKEYQEHVKERAEQGLPPLPLNSQQVAALIELIKNPPAGQEQYLLELLIHRVPPGVDQAAYVKAGFLAAVAKGEVRVASITPQAATKLLGTMLGGYNIHPLIDLLDNEQLAETAVEALSNTLLIFDAYNDVVEKSKTNPNA